MQEIVSKMNEGPTILAQRTSYGALLFMPKTVHTEDSGDTPLLMYRLPVNPMWIADL